MKRGGSYFVLLEEFAEFVSRVEMLDVPVMLSKQLDIFQLQNLEHRIFTPFELLQQLGNLVHLRGIMFFVELSQPFLVCELLRPFFLQDRKYIVKRGQAIFCRACTNYQQKQGQHASSFLHLLLGWHVEWDPPNGYLSKVILYQIT